MRWLQLVLVLAEKGLILLTVGVGYLSSFPRSSAAWRGGLGGAGPWWGRLTPTGQRQVHSVPRDTVTGILRGGSLRLVSGTASSWREVSGCVTCGLFQRFVPPLPSPSPWPLRLSLVSFTLHFSCCFFEF